MAHALRLALRLAVFLAALSPLMAAADPPARVGRLSLIEGNVVFRTDRQDAGAPATANWPISSGAILDTDRSGRAEIRVGSSAFRLGGGSRVEFTAVDDQRVALQISQGSLAVTVRERDQADGINIGTPAGQIRFGAPGRYRIDVDESNGNTQVTSRDGLASLYRPGGELSVSGGQRAVAYAGGGWFVTEPRPDAFDDWSDARDSVSHAPAARRYVSPQMTGYEDLDRYGSWSSSPDYGTVWYPSALPAGWAPYRYGRWAWVAPWGWTWIDEAPWGFAPFHYGRWALIGGQWAWVPGAYTPRPVFAPALVAWVGNPGWSVGFSFGSSPAVGWFPLAPHEVFVPAYRCSPTYVRQVNVTNVTNVTVIEQVTAGRRPPMFANRAYPQAVTVVPARMVQSGSPIIPGALRQPEQRELARAPVAARAPGTAWLPPAATALRPHHDDDAPLGRMAPLQRPNSPLPKSPGSPGDPAPAGPALFGAAPGRQLPTPATVQPAQPSPAAPKAAPQGLPPPRHEGEPPAPPHRFNLPSERAPSQPEAPAVRPGAIADAPQPRLPRPEPAPEPRAIVQPPVQPQSPKLPPPAPAHEASRLPEMPRMEAAVPNREFRHPGRPEFERPVPERQAAPVMREAAPHPIPAMPRFEPPAARQGLPGESQEHRREHGKGPNSHNEPGR